MERYFGFFADLIQEFPADVEEQDFYYGNTVELYDQICHGNGEFSQFQQAIALHGGPVLDLCCGSGRLTIPTAKLGICPRICWTSCRKTSGGGTNGSSLGSTCTARI